MFNKLCDFTMFKPNLYYELNNVFSIMRIIFRFRLNSALSTYYLHLAEYYKCKVQHVA